MRHENHVRSRHTVDFQNPHSSLPRCSKQTFHLLMSHVGLMSYTISQVKVYLSYNAKTLGLAHIVARLRIHSSRLIHTHSLLPNHCKPTFLLGAKKLFKVTPGSSHLRLWSARPQISARSMTAAIRACSDTTSIHAETLRNGSIRIQGQTQKRGRADQAGIFLFSSLFPILCRGKQFKIIIDGKREVGKEATETRASWRLSGSERPPSAAGKVHPRRRICFILPKADCLRLAPKQINGGIKNAVGFPCLSSKKSLNIHN